jgi:hypothetical protein
VLVTIPHERLSAAFKSRDRLFLLHKRSDFPCLHDDQEGAEFLSKLRRVTGWQW